MGKQDNLAILGTYAGIRVVVFLGFLWRCYQVYLVPRMWGLDTGELVPASSQCAHIYVSCIWMVVVEIPFVSCASVSIHRQPPLLHLRPEE
jgi:hypothetical protein